MEYLSHIRRDGNRQMDVGQTTTAHLLGVMKYAGRFAEGMHLSKIAQLTGVLHDMGKMCRDFVDYLWDSYRHPENRSKHQKIDHSAVGAQYLWNRFGVHGTDFEKLTSEWAAMVIMSHHAGLDDFLTVEGESPFIRRMDKALDHYEEATRSFFTEVMPEEQLEQLFHEAVREMEVFLERVDKAAGESDEAFYFYRGMTVKFLFSVLLDADRLQTANFMNDTDFEKHWDTESLWDSFSEKLERRLQSFPRPDNPQQSRIFDARKGISDACLASAERAPGLFTLSVPTGSGKTLASMRFALAHAKKYRKQRILVVIPYTSIIDQNAAEIRNVFQLDYFDEELLEHHSNVLTDTDWKERAKEEQSAKKEGKTANYEESEPEDYSEDSERRRATTERWDVPIIFTTQVQFLNTLFAGGTKSLRRLHALENSIIIFDEIQTLPVKCTYLFNEAMNFLKEFAGVTAVLCTATQPELSELKVPLKKAAEAEIVNNLADIFSVFQRVRIENHAAPGGSSADEIAAHIWHDAMERGNVLCIVNTTASARRIYQSLCAYMETQEVKIKLIHLSTKLCPAHRRKLLETIREHLKPAAPERLICVSTQLIEAGVDVSFATVYRALAGFSSIAQAAGRCNRHGEMPYGVVKIFQLESERLDKLEDIRRGMDVAERMLHDYSADTILSPTVMQKYFLRYYQDCRNMLMSYPTTTKGTLYDLLSFNEMGDNAQQARGDECGLLDYQAFRSAGREFSVIDQYNVGVLVPYEHGADLIEEFESGIIYEKKIFYKKMKESQQYMVNLYSYEIDALGGYIKETKGGVLVLDECAYDKALGVKVKGLSDELLCF